MIFHKENDCLQRDECLQRLTHNPLSHAKIGFFDASSQQSEQTISCALMSGTELPTDVREINAFIRDYADDIHAMMGQYSMDTKHA